MVRLSRSAPMLIIAVAALSTAACRKKQPVVTTPTPTVNQDSINAANAERARQDSIARANQARQDSINAADAARRAAEEAAARRLAEARNLLQAMIYFDLDMADIRDDSKATLDQKIPLLNANPNLTIKVTGHTDSRGSDEYNIALGQRRARAVRDYLVRRGIAASRITLDSRGEEQPVAQGEDESAWSQNRRAEFEITAGGENLVLPNS
jgi:peptidoglycan-associated lipoprotein